MNCRTGIYNRIAKSVKISEVVTIVKIEFPKKIR